MKGIQKNKDIHHTWIPTSKKYIKQCATCKVFKKSFYDLLTKKITTGYCYNLYDEKPFATTFDCKP